MPEVDSLEIKIAASSTDAAKKVNDLASALERLQRSAGGGGLAKAKEQIDSIGAAAGSARPRTTTQKRADALDRIVKDALDSSVVDSKTFEVDDTPIKDAVGSARNLAEEFMKANSKVDILNRKAEALQDALQGALARGDYSAADRIALKYQSVADQIKKIEDSAPGAVSALDRLKAAFNKGIAPINKWKSAIGRIVFYRTIRAAIRAVTEGISTGINNLYQYSTLVKTDFAPAMDKLATSSLYLKNSLGTLAAPLIEALAPAVDMLVDKIVDLFNAISRTFAYLQGKDVYTAAKKHAVQYKEAADDAYKATKKFLLGIDELNIFDPGSGGATSALEDYGDMFEERSIEANQFMVNLKDVIFEWSDFTPELVAEKVLAAVFGGAGAIIGWSLGGPFGAMIGASLGVAFGVLVGTKSFNSDGTLSSEEIAKLIMTGIFGVGGGIIGWALGGPFGAAIGLSVGGALSMSLNGVLFDGNGNITKDEIIKGILDVLLTAGGGIIGFGIGGPFGAAIGVTIGAGLSIAFNTWFNDGGNNKADILKNIVDILAMTGGGIIGFAVGGPVGAAIGIAIGAGLSIGFRSLFEDGGMSKDALINNIVSVLGVAAGGIIGFFVGGPLGMAIGMAIGAGVSMLIKATMEDGGLSAGDMLKKIVGVLAIAGGGVIGFMIGGPLGAVIGMAIGVGLTMAINSLTTTGTDEAGEILRSTGMGLTKELKNGIEQGESEIQTKIGSMSDNIASRMASLSNNAKKWGKEISDNLANGINSGIGNVERAANSVADRVASYIHFSEPDIGPLSDFHTFMPDMLKQMAQGIKDNSYLAVNAMNDLAGSMSEQMPGVSADMDYSAAYSSSYAGNGQSVSGDGYAAESNMEIVNAVYAMAERIVKAINEKDNNTYMDGKAMARGLYPYMEQVKNEKGASLVRGGGR